MSWLHNESLDIARERVEEIKASSDSEPIDTVAV